MTAKKKAIKVKPELKIQKTPRHKKVVPPPAEPKPAVPERLKPGVGKLVFREGAHDGVHRHKAVKVPIEG